jgi:phosphoglycolate phosphatase-like HAD superfamily hydrolase
LIALIVTRDQVRFAKPDPDLFLTAAERLGVEIGTASVVGDSVWDMLASRRARTLGIGLLCTARRSQEGPRWAAATLLLNKPIYSRQIASP